MSNCVNWLNCGQNGRGFAASHQFWDTCGQLKVIVGVVLVVLSCVVVCRVVVLYGVCCAVLSCVVALN